MYDDFRIILVGTTHPGNIGAVARAMKTSKFQNLYLVNPKIYPSDEATARAAGAVDVLEQAIVVDSLEAALSDVELAFATSTRARSLSWPLGTPKQMVQDFSSLLPQKHIKKAIVFGRESTGLTNDELQKCQYHITIPANPDYSSLNLAAAVQVICYELHSFFSETLPLEPHSLNESCDEWVNGDELERFYAHLNAVLVDIEFLDPTNPRLIMERMRRLFARSRLNKTELNILRGVLTSIQKKIK